MEDEYWAKFATTGSITDYLSYRDAVKAGNRKEETAQGESYDGKYYSDRNNPVGRAHW